MERSGGVAAIVGTYHRKHSETRLLLHLSRDGERGISVGSLREKGSGELLSLVLLLLRINQHPRTHPTSLENVELGCCGPANLPKRRKVSKSGYGEGAKGPFDSFGPREQRSPKSLLHLPNPLLRQCSPISHQCKRPLARGVQKTFCTLS